jgi:hypothetical protein
VAHDDGSPTAFFVSVYRVPEHVPTSAMKKYFLVIQHEATLGLDSSEVMPGTEGGLYLYLEIASVSPLVDSRLKKAGVQEWVRGRSVQAWPLSKSLT